MPGYKSFLKRDKSFDLFDFENTKNGETIKITQSYLDVCAITVGQFSRKQRSRLWNNLCIISHVPYGHLLGQN